MCLLIAARGCKVLSFIRIAFQTLAMTTENKKDNVFGNLSKSFTFYDLTISIIQIIHCINNNLIKKSNES